VQVLACKCDSETSFNLPNGSIQILKCKSLIKQMMFVFVAVHV